jgi:hypothetical protein
MALYRIRNPDIKKLALVKRPASGHRFHLLKSRPEPDEAAKKGLLLRLELNRFVDGRVAEHWFQLDPYRCFSSSGSWSYRDHDCFRAS